jgi:hypothetical protein
MIRRLLRWVIGAAVVACVAALLVWAFLGGRQELARERERERALKVPPRTARTQAGEVVVTLDRETQKRIALRTEALAARTLEPEVAAYGSLQEDASRSFTLRAPVAGQLRPPPGRDWPAIGTTLADGVVVGQIEPRIAPVERVDLASRLAAARAEADAVTASLAAARAAWERAKALNAENKIVSDRAVQEAEARVKGEEARLRAFNETARLIDASLRATTGATGARHLVAERGGEVVEVLAQPGEAVESGLPILRLARFDRLVARVHLPAGQNIDRMAPTARIVVFGHEAQPLRGVRIGLGAAADPTTRGEIFLFRVEPAGFPLRPGASVTAYLPVAGRARRGVVVPRAAIVRAEGRAWAYLQVGEQGFARREVQLETPTETGWFMAAGFKAGDRVVVDGAQTLLSEEFKSQIPIGDESADR